MRHLHLQSRAIMFWSFILITVGLVAAFGLPYGRYAWSEKAWAQEIYNTPEQETAPVAALLPPAINNFLPDQQSNVVIGREDTNGDGAVDETDGVVVLVPVLDASGVTSTFEALDFGDVVISNVLDVQFAADGSGVVVALLADQTTAVFIVAPGGRVIRVEGLPPLVNPVVQLGSLYLANNSSTNNPPTLYVIDETTGQITSTLQLQRANTEILFDPQGDYMLAFTPTSQRVSVVNLANLEGTPLSFQFSGNIVAAPRWSSTGGRLFFVEQSRSSGEERMTVLDATAGTRTSLPLPTYADDLDLFGEWSATGRYVTLAALNEDGTRTDQPLTIVDIQEGTTLSLQLEGMSYLPFGWSADDSALAYFTTSLEDGEDAVRSVALFTVGDMGSTTLDLGDRAPLALAWHPTEARLALLVPAATVPDTYDVLIYEVASGELESVSSVEVAAFTALSLNWVDGTGLGLALTFDDLVLESVLNTTYRIDTLTGEKTQLLPESIRLD
ncbi:MAG: hypothetical protein SF029_24470 [bacterium]|nr:hypothetical protein [bacterium]